MVAGGTFLENRLTPRNAPLRSRLCRSRDRGTLWVGSVFLTGSSIVPDPLTYARLFRGDRGLPGAQSFGSGGDLDASRLAVFAAYDQERQAVERLAIVRLEGLDSGSVAVVHAGDPGRTLEREFHQVVGEGAEVAVFILHAHGDEREVVAIGGNGRPIRRQHHSRGGAGRLDLGGGDPLAALVGHGFQRARRVGHLPHQAVLGLEFSVLAGVVAHRQFHGFGEAFLAAQRFAVEE